MSEIELKHIYKDYQEGDHAVADFNLKINDGEFVVFVGPSGCGKSTTLRMIAGLEEITSGECLIDGEIVNDKVPKDRDIAMVFQNYALYPQMTVRKNMSFGLKMKGINQEKIDKKVNDTAQKISMTDLLERLPKELSGGQRQRVALGRAIVREPKVFLMDEPLSNLDAKLRAQTRTEINLITRNLGTTTLYVTHDQVEAMTMADRIVVMNQGRIQQIGTPREIYLEPLNQFVAGFIGSPTMNFLPAEWKDNNLYIAGHQLPINEKNRSLLNISHHGKITVGIRPENIRVSKTKKEGAKQLKVKLSEMLGSEILIYFDVFGEDIVAKKTTLEKFDEGESVYVSIDERFLYFFDERGDRIFEN